MFGKLRDMLTLNKALGQYEDIRKEIDTMDSKHLFMSKTFWANVGGLALTVAGILPQKWAVPVMAVANVILRIVSNQPVNIFPKDTLIKE